MSKLSKSRHADALAWKPQLKNARRKSRGPSSSHSMEVASQALSAMRSIESARGKQVQVDDRLVAELAKRCQSMPHAGSGRRGGPTKQPEAGAKKTGPRLLIGGAVAAVALLGGMLFFGGELLPVRRHVVAGTVWLDKIPLGLAELRFHSTRHETANATTILAGEDGRFRLEDLPADTYRVTVHPTSQPAPTKVAAAYSERRTTPFELRVNRDIESVRFYAHAVLPKPRKPAWKPGVD